MHQRCTHLPAPLRENSHARAVDLGGLLLVGLGAVHVGPGGAVDHHARRLLNAQSNAVGVGQVQFAGCCRRVRAVALLKGGGKRSTEHSRGADEVPVGSLGQADVSMRGRRARSMSRRRGSARSFCDTLAASIGQGIARSGSS